MNRAAVCLVLLAGLAVPGLGQESAARAPAGGQSFLTIPSSGGEFKIYHETLEKDGARVFAAGNVEIHYRDVRLFADRVELDTETKDVLAEGRVTLQLPNEVITADRIVYNLDSALGRMDAVSGMVQPTVFYEAASVEKTGPDLYALSEARLTSCAQPTPRWLFSFGRAELRKDEYVDMWGAVFRLKKVPVFYIPYMRYPLNQERATGFLTPQIGFSGIKGFSLSQSFYWAMARNMDATVSADLYSAKGMGGGIEYRYLFRGGTGGQVNVYGFLFKADETGVRPDPAAIVRLRHNQPLPAGFSLVADIDYQSSFDFLREFDNNFRRAVIANRSSQVYLSRAWGAASLNVRASQFETYFNQGGFDDSIVRKQLPQVNFNVFQVRLLPSLYFSLASSLSRWQYGWRTQYEDEDQRRSSEIKVSPSLSLPFKAIPWLTLSTYLTANFNYYGQSFAPNTRDIVDEPLFTRSVVAELSLRGPVFLRIFHGSDGEPRLKHVIEPFAEYRYDSPIHGSRNIVTTYGFFRYHQISYGLTNTFLVRRDGMPHEALQFVLSQTYYIAPEESPLSWYEVDGEIPRYSELGGTVRVRPGGGTSLDVSAGYNPYYKEISSLHVRGGIGSPRDAAHLNVSWYKSVNSWNRVRDDIYDIFNNRHQIAVWGGVRLPGGTVELLGDMDFNIVERQLLYAAATMVYHYQCLDFGLEARLFYFREQPDLQFKFSFGLGNIGKTTDFLGGAGVGR